MKKPNKRRPGRTRYRWYAGHWWPHYEFRVVLWPVYRGKRGRRAPLGPGPA